MTTDLTRTVSAAEDVILSCGTEIAVEQQQQDATNNKRRSEILRQIPSTGLQRAPFLLGVTGKERKDLAILRDGKALRRQ